MEGFKQIYERLNAEQRQAVDTIDGPLLVLAGPGTGKTQLLSARVANILLNTDTLAQNILCLTFTESGARAMRERLGTMIGPASYDVHISTYHGFGSDIIRSYPDYFMSLSMDSTQDSRLERPIDDLTKTQIIESIIAKLPWDSPLKSAQYYIKSVVDTIGELKKSLVTPEKLRAVAQQNQQQIAAVSPHIQEIYGAVGRIPKISEALPIFNEILEVLHKHPDGLAEQAAAELEVALTTATETNKTSALTEWKNEWLHRDEAGDWMFTNPDISGKMEALARVFESYKATLQSRGLYDFDDMILKSIDAFKEHPDLLYNLQEKYQYILLDEFQDTNAAQFEIVRQLANHPVHEGRPNIMAVGDDDQAIYAFQGADISNMLRFTKEFVDVPVINLTQNYRSHQHIIHAAHAVAGQIETRLHLQLQNISKTLEAASRSLPKEALIERHEFGAQASEYAWIADKISGLIADGVEPSEIAVLSPKHARLESLVPFLNRQQIPVSYEKRENILDTPLVQALEVMSRLCAAIASQNTGLMNQLFPVVLSLDFWQIPTEHIWQINWQTSKKGSDKAWAEAALEVPDLKPHVLFFLKAGSLSPLMPLEYMLDYLTGVQPINIDPDTEYVVPFKAYYFSGGHTQANPQAYFEAISHLSVIRMRLRDYQTGEDDVLHIQDFLNFINMYRSAEQPLINSHPIAQADSAVQLMTAYKAKGLEFAYVFLLSVHDDIWGKKARSNNNKIGLPANLTYIRYFGSGEDELRRLLFVAITRAKHGLFMTSHAATDGGKATEPVKYLLEAGDGDERTIGIFPEQYARVIRNPHAGSSIQEAVELLWQQRHVQLSPPLKSLLKERLEAYKMSPTHLNTFVDMEYGGPDAFLLRTLLRFPQAPEPDGEFGTAVHDTLDWYQNQLNKGMVPAMLAVIKQFDTQLNGRYIARELLDDYRARGHRALHAYIPARSGMFQKSAQSEVDFYNEAVVLDGKAILTGKIDRLEVDKQNKTVHIVDYKTGHPAYKWDASVKMLKYKQQLHFYKLLIEGSKTFRGFKVEGARLEFVEPDNKGAVVPPLEIRFDDKSMGDNRRLVLAVWNLIQSLEYPDVSGFTKDLRGTNAFIKSLLEQ